MSELQSEKILRRIAGRAAKTIELDLERLPALLERLGQPHLRLPPVIHVAGTNGKGSTLAFLNAMLTSVGRRVQSFTSPYLVRLTEEIVLSTGEISDGHLADLLSRVEDAGDGIDPTGFEALAAAAFLAFAEDADADVLLLETAMGGRLDVTNVVPRPAVTVISPIAMDHMAFLGNTIQEIASHKAGIMKPGVPCVANPMQPDAEQIIVARAADLDVPLRLAGRDFRVDRDTGWFHGETSGAMPLPGLRGSHQWDNAALASAAMEFFDPELMPGVLSAVADASWPARMQLIADNGPEIWVDGGHNSHAAAAMAETIRNMDDKPLLLIIGMLDNRPLKDFLECFVALDLSPTVIAVPLPSQPVYSVGLPMLPEDIAGTARQLGLDSLTAGSVDDALSRVGEFSVDARILITGSLYLAGRAAADLSQARMDQKPAS